MKITLHQLEAENAKLNRAIETARIEFERKIAGPKETFQKKLNAASAQYDELMNEYFANNVLDKNNTPVMPGHIITEDGVTFFKVKKRRMSADHNGKMGFPFIICSRMDQKKSGDIHISDSDLKKFEIKGKGSSSDSEN